MAVEGLSIRLYFDQHVRAQFAVDLRRAGFDVVTSQEVGNERASDPEHLEWATSHRRALFTHDLGDFVLISQEWFLDEHDHSGIIISVQPGKTSYGELLRRFLKLLETLTADDMINMVEWLDNRWSGTPDS